MAQRNAASGSKAGTAAKATAASARAPRSKAQQATSKTEQELRAERRASLIRRLAFSILLLFLTLFLVLSLVGVRAVFLDFLSMVFKGLLGYGTWILPAALLYIAWILFFLHEESIRGRVISTVLVVPAISALIHTLFCRIDFQPGFSILKSLWSTGTEMASGGVISGAVAQMLKALLSRAGAVPVLILAILVLAVFMLRLSPAKMIHNRAEKRREALSEMEAENPPQEEPEPYDTRADLRILATPVVRPKVPAERTADQPRRQRSFDLPFGGKIQQAHQLSLDELEEPEPDGLPEEDEDLIFTRRHRKNRRQEPVQERPKTQPSPFNITIHDDYTAQVQELVRQEMGVPEPAKEPEPDTIQPIWETPSEPPVPMEELSESALEVMKEKKVSHGEAKLAAAQVAMEIEKKTDEEAQEKPVYQYPPMTMLAEAQSSREDNTEEMRTNVRRLEETLESFGVDSKINNVVRGPAVTRYEMELKPGVKMSKITSLQDDIALALGVTSVHVAAVPGKSSTIGIEVPNAIVTSVPIREVLNSREFRSHKSVLAFAVGKDISGNYIIGDISKMPHLLIAGTTGSGKSVCMNGIIVSLLYRDSPEQCRLIMIDPKVVELSIYNGVPHLLIPVVTDPKKAAGALQWAVTEMDRRYNRFEAARVRDLAGYNKKAAADPELEPMPRIVIIIDELADLMMVAAKEVETSIARLAAKARAAGMHLVIATQRPSADVITGVIKANIPSRIAFAVSSALESNIIMGTRGAEKLLGKGDMFYAPQGATKPKRVQGCFISDEEVESVAEFVKNSSETDYSDEILNEIEQNAASAASSGTDSDSAPLSDSDGDPQLAEAVEVVLDTKQASVSMLQRRLKLGYAHAARIMDEMEEKGIVGPFEGSKPRQLLITREQWAGMVGINPNAVAADSPSAEGLDNMPFDEEDY